MRARAVPVILLWLAAVAARADAHVGSPDVFLDATAGPYHLFVTVRPPHAVPGIADVEILTTDDDVRDVRIVPMPLTGPGAQFAPAPDRAQQSPDSKRTFTGHLWMMSAGAWQVRISVDGARGPGALSVPVPTLPQSTLAMTGALRAMLFALMVLLAAGFVAIVSAIAREATLPPGAAADRRARRRGRITGAVAAAAALVVIVLGNWWWTAEASSYDRYVYKPLDATTAIDGARLSLTVRDPGWIPLRRLDDFVPDHGHVMHLFVLSSALDRFWHLHPRELDTGRFDQQLPDLPAGRYQLFADVVHASGVSETVVAQLDAPAVHGAPLTGDDSEYADAHGEARLTPTATTSIDTAGSDAERPNDTRIVWVRGAERIVPRQLTLFTFRVEDDAGQPVHDLELYMGMPGHAVFVRRDFRVFAHVHPSGSAPMAALEISQRGLAATQPAAQMHAGHMMAATVPATISFPYGIPEPGDYRVFVQVKRAGRIVTGAFDLHVD